MITRDSKLAVTSRTFSRSKELKDLLRKEFNNIKYNEDGIHFDDQNLITFLDDCEAAIVSGEKLSKEVIKKLPHLKIVSKFGVGLDGIDVDFLKEKGIKLSWKSGVNANSVAELTLCYLILMLREAQQLNRDLNAGHWSKVNNSRDLSEVTIGIIGFGQIGKTLATYLEYHKSRILAYDPFIKDDMKLESKVEFHELDSLLRQSDAVTLHVPLSDSTVEMIGDREIKLMKKNSVLLNLSRGGIVSEQAVYKALKTEHIAGAAFDVFEDEPNINPKLVQLKNFFGTPHIAGTSKNSIHKLGLAAINGLVESIDM